MLLIWTQEFFNSRIQIIISGKNIQHTIFTLCSLPRILIKPVLDLFNISPVSFNFFLLCISLALCVIF